MDQRTCPGCGGVFQPKRKEQKVCGRGCVGRTLPVSMPCPVCGSSFAPKNADQATCSKRCAALKSHQENPRHLVPDQSKLNSPEARARKSKALRGANNPMAGRTGALNPAFVNGVYSGTSEYRRHRKPTCADCGATKNPSGRGLAVHHDDGDHYNNDPANLVTLCLVCHAKRHAAMRGDS